MGAHPGESFSSEFNSIQFNDDFKTLGRKERGKHIFISQHS
jgi:hypothetical protein